MQSLLDVAAQRLAAADLKNGLAGDGHDLQENGNVAFASVVIALGTVEKLLQNALHCSPQNSEKFRRVRPGNATLRERLLPLAELVEQREDSVAALLRRLGFTLEEGETLFWLREKQAAEKDLSCLKRYSGSTSNSSAFSELVARKRAKLMEDERRRTAGSGKEEELSPSSSAEAQLRALRSGQREKYKEQQTLAMVEYYSKLHDVNGLEAAPPAPNPNPGGDQASTSSGQPTLSAESTAADQTSERSFLGGLAGLFGLGTSSAEPALAGRDNAQEPENTTSSGLLPGPRPPPTHPEPDMITLMNRKSCKAKLVTCKACGQTLRYLKEDTEMVLCVCGNVVLTNWNVEQRLRRGICPDGRGGGREVMAAMQNQLPEAGQPVDARGLEKLSMGRGPMVAVQSISYYTDPGAGAGGTSAGSAVGVPEHQTTERTPEQTSQSSAAVGVNSGSGSAGASPSYVQQQRLIPLHSLLSAMQTREREQVKHATEAEIAALPKRKIYKPTSSLVDLAFRQRCDQEKRSDPARNGSGTRSCDAASDDNQTYNHDQKTSALLEASLQSGHERPFLPPIICLGIFDDIGVRYQTQIAGKAMMPDGRDEQHQGAPSFQRKPCCAEYSALEEVRSTQRSRACVGRRFVLLLLGMDGRSYSGPFPPMAAIEPWMQSMAAVGGKGPASGRSVRPVCCKGVVSTSIALIGKTSCNRRAACAWRTSFQKRKTCCRARCAQPSWRSGRCRACTSFTWAASTTGSE